MGRDPSAVSSCRNRAQDLGRIQDASVELEGRALRAANTAA